MNIEIKDIITLSDNNKYVVTSKVNYQNNMYLYLFDINDNENIKFCLEQHKDNKITVIEVEDKELIKELLPLFYNETKIAINSFETE